MNMKFIVCCLITFLPLAAAQQWPDYGADEVARFIPGTGQTNGHGPEYFPQNVLGLPDTSARYEVASVDPYQILSLGLGGEIVLRFDRHIIVDGPGPDFTVFENAFHYKLGQKEKIYAEPAEVSVSRDGITYTPFPFDSLSLVGCAGVTPTNGDRNPTDPSVSGGDSFDLAAIGIDSVRYIRIRDITAMVLGNKSHPFWDATLSGFDLDAVVGVNVAAPAPLAVAEENGSASTLRFWPNPATGRAWLELSSDHETSLRLRFFDLLGREITAREHTLSAGRQRLPVDLSELDNGSYLLRLETDKGLLGTMQLQVVQ